MIILHALLNYFGGCVSIKNNELFEDINNKTYTFITIRNMETGEINFIQKIDLNFC